MERKKKMDFKREIKISSNFKSQYGQDRFCYENFLKYIPSQGFFVEVGASDGVKFSNTWFYEKILGWTGLCIEPRKKVYSTLLKNRSCFCENVGIAPEEKEGIDFLEMEGYGEGMSGIVKNYHPRHLHTINNYIKRHKDHKSTQVTKINTVPLQKLLDKYVIPHINFLSVDTEGGELDILKTIDWDETSVDVIIVENNYEDEDYFNSYLSQKGFRRVAKLTIDEAYININFLKNISGKFPITVSFTSKWADHKQLVSEYKSTLPNNKNWMHISPSPEGKILVVMDDVKRDDTTSLNTDKTIVIFPREPPDINPDCNKKCLHHNTPYKYTYNTIYHCIPQFNFLQMNINELMKLSYEKSKEVSCIVSGKIHTAGAKKRLDFLRKLVDKHKDKIDVFGRNLDIGQEIKSKTTGLIPYKYSLCMENSQHRNYFTEKFTDAIVCWSVPIYWGCPNINEYFPPESYYCLDITSETAVEDFLNILKKPINIKALAHARNLVFSYYNVWNTIDRVLSGRILSSPRPIYGFFGFKQIYDKAVRIFEDGDNILEIGAFLGKSTSYMCEILQKHNKKVNFYVIDPWEKDLCAIQRNLPEDMFKKFKENMKSRGYLKMINPIKATSKEAYEKLKHLKFKFIFVDGSHLYKDVIDDLKLYGPLVLENGIFAGDDYQAEGVRKAVHEYFKTNFITIKGEGNIMWEKKSQRLFLDSLPRTPEGHWDICHTPIINYIKSAINPKVIMEIGLNNGYSTAMWLFNLPTASLHSIDIGTHKFIPKVQSIFKKYFGKRFSYETMNSLDLHKRQYPIFDLIIVDGGHSQDVCYSDLLFSLKQGKFVLLDDTGGNSPGVISAWEKFEKTYKDDFVLMKEWNIKSGSILFKNVSKYMKIDKVPSYSVYIIFHREIYPNLYKDIDYKHFKLLKTEGYERKEFERFKEYKKIGFEIIEENKLPFYDSTLQPNKYHAPSAIYHFYKNNLHKDLDYIGFLEYDFEFDKTLSDIIEQSIALKKTGVLFSCRHRIFRLFQQDDITVNGKNAILDAIHEYNKFFETKHNYKDLLRENPLVCSQQSFLCNKNTFVKLGKFLSYLIERKPSPKYIPRPSTVFERYIAIFLEFQSNTIKINLSHGAFGYHKGYKYK